MYKEFELEHLRPCFETEKLGFSLIREMITGDDKLFVFKKGEVTLVAGLNKFVHVTHNSDTIILDEDNKTIMKKIWGWHIDFPNKVDYKERAWKRITF